MDCNLPGSSVHGDSPDKNTGVDCHTLLQGIFPTQGSNPGLPHCRQILYRLSHHGSPRILEWVAYPFSRGSSQPRNWIGSPALQTDSLPIELPGKHKNYTEAEERISELKDRMIEITAKEQKKEWKDLKMVSEISVIILNTNIWIIGIPEEEGSSLVAQMVKNLPAM